MENLVLVDGAYLSTILLETCVKNNIPVHIHNKELENLAKQYTPNVRIVDENEAKTIAKKANAIYTTAESMLPLAIKEECIQNIKIFKDKVLFRKTLSSLPEYKDFFFREVDSNELLNFEPSLEKSVIKPAIGFFSIGVKVCSKDDFTEQSEKALEEVRNASATYPSTVIRNDKWIIEEYIEGKEFAADVYFDNNGDVVVNAIYSHPFKDEKDTRDVLYYSNTKIMKEQGILVREFLKKLSGLLPYKLRNFPLHMEYRIRNNTLYPIEINPWRFGGFGLSDLPAVWGLNQYERFFGIKSSVKVNMKEDVDYAFILCRNPSDMKPGRYTVDHEGYKKTLNELEISVQQYTPFDHHRFGVSSVTNCEAYNEKSMMSLLEYDTAPHYSRA